MVSAVIIDDIEKARSSLKRELEDYCPEVAVIGEADSVVSGLKLLKKKSPDVVFLDIHLTDGSGFDILELQGNLDFNVIFTTSSDAHAIRAFKFSAVDYLLKPIDPDELVVAVEKISNGGSKDTSINLLKDNLRKGPLERVALHTLDKIQICRIDEIVRCEAQVNYCNFVFVDGTQLLVTKTLKHFDKLLSDSGFLRVHQSHLINLKHIKEYVKSDGGYVVMDNGDLVTISSRKRHEVISRLSGLR